MTENQEEEPKIIVDSDWKEQVQKEREIAEDGDPVDAPEVSGEPDATGPPPASFTVLVSMLFSQAMVMLGQMPGPDGKPEINKPFAKHTIDTLEVLEAKTAGNLDDDEKNVLSEALHVLRMAFVNTKG